MAVGPGNTVFQGIGYGFHNSGGQLFAYNFNGTSFTKTAQIEDHVSVEDIAVAADGTIFLATWQEGMLAYTYSSEITGIERNFALVPQDYTLSQNYPNPFNPITNIQFSIPKTEFVSLKIYNLLGQKVTTLVDKKQPAGSYQVQWDASRFASGVYYYQLKVGDYVQTRKMVLLK